MFNNVTKFLSIDYEILLIEYVIVKVSGGERDSCRIGVSVALLWYLLVPPVTDAIQNSCGTLRPNSLKMQLTTHPSLSRRTKQLLGMLN